MTNSFTEKYHQEYPTRTLRFGVRGEEIVCLRISTITAANSLDPAQDSAAYTRRKDDLIQIQDALLRASPTRKFNFQDGAHSIKYMVNCSPDTNSIFQQELEIAPVTNRNR